MRRIIVIVPELLGEPSILRQKLQTLERIAEMGVLFKIHPIPSVETPEALYLGLKPDEGQLRQGPLTVAALGADPPERSTHFHLSLMSFAEGEVRVPKMPGRAKPFSGEVEVDSESLREIMRLSEKLNTKTLTVVTGEGLDHGLVWEALGDLRTIPPRECDGKPIKPNLPEGDGEALLRRFIDDSINLLSESELNQRRLGEDLPPLNLLWPWGQGVRTSVPNLALRRGDPALVVSASQRLRGLARLAGYRHVARDAVGRGTNTRLAKIAALALAEPVTIVVLDAIAVFRDREMFEEASWFAKELDSALLDPLFQEALVNPTRIVVLSPGQTDGLGAMYETGNASSNSVPFDERALEERTLPSARLWEAVSRSL